MPLISPFQAETVSVQSHQLELAHKATRNIIALRHCNFHQKLNLCVSIVDLSAFERNRGVWFPGQYQLDSIMEHIRSHD